MGLSGSGKSTLVRCLSRLVEPSAGEVLFNGRDLLRASPRRDDRDPPPQDGHGVPAFRAAAAPDGARRTSPSRWRSRACRAAAREARAREMIELVGLAGREANFPRQLSGGQQQRVGIARSLAVEPELWFLDEPFSALDPLIRREMQDEFLRVQRLLQKTIVFITHDFDEAIRLADRIAIMQDGAIIQTGTPEELVLNPGRRPMSPSSPATCRAPRCVTLASVMAPATAPAPAGSARPTLSRRSRRASRPSPIAVVEDGGLGCPHTVADAAGHVGRARRRRPGAWTCWSGGGGERPARGSAACWRSPAAERRAGPGVSRRPAAPPGSTGPPARGCALDMARLGRRCDGVAGRRRPRRAVELPRPDARHRLAARPALPARPRRCWSTASARPGPGGGRQSCRRSPGSRWCWCRGHPGIRPRLAARGARRALLPLPGGLRPVGERHGHARLGRRSPCRSGSPAGCCSASPPTAGAASSGRSGRCST